MSAAGALSTTLALSQLIDRSRNDAIRASHFAEIQLKTGLGDVMASTFGGIEIRKEAGLPPWGIIEHIPGQGDIVLCVIGEELETKKVLLDKQKANLISQYGKICTKKLLDNPTIENFFEQSQNFTNKTGLANKKIIDAINVANNFGAASMCMLGNSIFAMGKTEQLCKVLSPFGKIFIGKID